MEAKTERFEMRLEPTTLNRIDEWRSLQGDLPSRAEAIRRLVETGLSQREKPSLRFSGGELLITGMLSEIMKHLGRKWEIDPKFVQEALLGGHYWALEWEHEGILRVSATTSELVHEVTEILNMWRLLEWGYEKLSAAGKRRIAKEAKPLGRNVRFSGFDGNNEAEHLSIARFLIEKMDRYEEFKGRNLNSHMAVVDGYRRMLEIYRPIAERLRGADLNADEIIAILKARRHPDWRNSKSKKN